MKIKLFQWHNQDKASRRDSSVTQKYAKDFKETLTFSLPQFLIRISLVLTTSISFSNIALGSWKIVHFIFSGQTVFNSMTVENSHCLNSILKSPHTGRLNCKVTRFFVVQLWIPWDSSRKQTSHLNVLILRVWWGQDVCYIMFVARCLLHLAHLEICVRLCICV